jgi:putative endonuclease
MDQRTLGRRGEWTALALLVIKGYRPRHRNWRGAGGEIDLVVERRGEIIFVEVKTRSTDLYGGAVAAVNATKKRNLTRASSAYLSRFGLWDRPCRFDIVAIERIDGFPFWRIRHSENAFRPDLGRQLC